MNISVQDIKEESSTENDENNNNYINPNDGPNLASKRKSDSLYDTALNEETKNHLNKSIHNVCTNLNSNLSLITSREKRIRKIKAYDDDFVTFGVLNNNNTQSSLNPNQIENNQINKDFAQNASITNESKFNVGDLVWAKVSGHPWWPCMISSPDLSDKPSLKNASSYNHTKYVGGARPKLMFYVEFFGPSIEHAWVTQHCLIDYKGIEEFKIYAQEQVDLCSTKSAKEKLAEKYQLKVTLSKRDNWELAVKEADQALDKSIQERKTIFINKNFNYDSQMRKSLSSKTDSLNGVEINSQEGQEEEEESCLNNEEKNEEG
jgi:hypothetical protein